MMKLSDIKERIRRIKYRIEKEYVFDEVGDVGVSMQADLVWTIEALAKLEEENEARMKFLGQALFFITDHQLSDDFFEEIRRVSDG